MENTSTIDASSEIRKTKNLRVEIDALIQAVKLIAPNREVSLVITKLQEAKHWAGENLGNYQDRYQQSEFADVAKGPAELDKTAGLGGQAAPVQSNVDAAPAEPAADALTAAAAPAEDAPAQ